MRELTVGVDWLHRQGCLFMPVAACLRFINLLLISRLKPRCLNPDTRKRRSQEKESVYVQTLAEKQQACEERTRKNAEKRRRKKEKKKRANINKEGGRADGGNGGGDSGSEEEEAEEEGSRKRLKEGGEGAAAAPIVAIKDDGSFLDTMKALLAQGNGDGGSGKA